MALAAIGSLIALIGVVWLIIISIQTGQTTGEKLLWALVNFLCQPIGGIVFYIVKKQGLVPLLLVIIGIILSGVGNYSMMGELQNQMGR
jgi:cytochrome c oxidase assembly factor CtaG